MTLTVAGNRPLMATGPPKTTKALNINSFPPGFVSKQLLSPDSESSSTSIVGTGGDLGKNVKSLSGMSAAAITLRASSNNTSHPIDKRDCINCPMNIVSDTPQPYLEPIKLLNKQSTDQRQQSLAAARAVISSALAQKTGALKQVSKSCFTGTKFPSASSRPIPPPKVLLKRQQSVKIEPAERGSRPSEEEDLSPTSANKRELAYLIVDLESGRSAIGTKNNRALDDSDVGLTSLKEEKSYKFPVRSFTMSVPGDQMKRPVFKQRATSNTSLDSIEDSSAQSADVQDVTVETGDHCGKLNAASPGALSVDTEKRSPPTLDTLKEQSETQVSSAGAGVTVNGINGLDRNHSQASPPPIPPKRVLGKMSSLPSANGSGSPTVSRMIRDALPASSLAKTKKVQNTIARLNQEEKPTTAAGKSTTKSTLDSPKPAKNRLPPPKPKPYTERMLSPPPPPPPSFPPPPRPTSVSTSASKPPSPPANRDISSPVPPPKKLTSPGSPPVTRKVLSPVPPPKNLTLPTSPPANSKIVSPVPPSKKLTSPASPPARRKVVSPVPPPKNLTAPTSPSTNRKIASPLPPSKKLTSPLAGKKVPPPALPPKNLTTPTSPLPSRKALSPVPPSNNLTTPPMSSSRRMSSPNPPPKNSITPLSHPNVGMRLSHSHHSFSLSGTPPSQGKVPRNRLHSDSKSNKPKPPKPPPPSRPPPVNPKLSQLISEHRNRSKSTAGEKGPFSKGNPSISEPHLISTTMKSDSKSLTDLRTLVQDVDIDEQIEQDDEVIPCSNISYVATSYLFPKEAEDHPCAVYEDIDAVIPLPPPRTDLVKKPFRRRSIDSAPPELPPKECHSDPTGRRHIAKKSSPSLPPKTHLTKSMSSGAKVRSTSRYSPETPTHRSGEQMDTVEPYCIKKLAPMEDEGKEWESDEEVVQDTGVYEPVMSPFSDNEEEETAMQEPDVSGVDEYVVMRPVMSRAWETDDGENKEDLPEDSYVEMQPHMAVNSPSLSDEDMSRNIYELDDEPEPVYIEMNPEEFVPPNKLHYASKDLLTNRSDLKTKQNKSKKLFTDNSRK